MKKRDPTKRCFIHTKLGRLAKNCINQAKVEDEKKEKANNIKSQMRHQ